MLVAALDLEMNQPTRSIIEIGVAVGDTETLEILSHKSFLVNPMENIREDIVKLTGITQDMVDEAPDLLRAYENMQEYLSEFSPKVHPMPITWGSGDARWLKEQLDNSHFCEFEWRMGRTEMNVKNIYQAHRMAYGLNTQGGLAKSMGKYGLKFEGTKHRAHDDAKNTLQLYFELLKRLKKM